MRELWNRRLTILSANLVFLIFSLFIQKFGLSTTRRVIKILRNFDLTSSLKIRHSKKGNEFDSFKNRGHDVVHVIGYRIMLLLYSVTVIIIVNYYFYYYHRCWLIDELLLVDLIGITEYTTRNICRWWKIKDLRCKLTYAYASYKRT